MGGRSSKTEEQPKRVLATSPTRTSSVCATSSNYSLNQNEISEHLRCEQPSVVPPVHSVANVLTLEPSLEALIVGYLSKTTMIAQLLPRRGTASTFVLINTDTVCSPECYRDSVVSLVKIQGNFPELKYRVLQFTYLRPNSVPQDREVVMVTKKVPGGALVVGMSFPMPTFVACNDDFKEDDYLLGRPTWLAPEVEEVKLCGIQCFIMNYENRERLALNKLALVDASFVGDDKTLENEILKADFMTRDDVQQDVFLRNASFQKKLYVTDVQNVRACHLEMEQKRKKTKTKTVQKTVLNTTVPPPNPSVPPPNYVAQVQSPTPSNSGPLSSSLYEGLVSALSTVSFKDRPATSGVVVGRLDKTRRITLPEVGMSEWLVLDDQSKNLAIECDSGYNKIVSDIHTFIKITKKSSLSDLHFNYHVDEYYNEEVTDDSTCQELVAVFNADSVGVVTVVGNSFVTPTLVPWELLEKPLQSGDFLIGNVHRLQPFFSATMMNGIVCYTKNLEEERKYIEQLEIHKRNRQAMKIRSPANMYYLTRVRPVYQGEIEKIANNCRHMQDLSISDANLYIRDVYIAIARLEKFMRLQSIEEHTLHVPGLTNIDRSGAQKRISLTVKLNEEETQQGQVPRYLESRNRSLDSPLRTERYIQRNGDFTAKTYEGGMTIERIDFDGKKCSVRLRPHPRSYDLFDMIANSKERLEGTFTIGPTDEYVETIVQALQSPAFTDFVMNRDLFDSWRGFRKNETVILDNTDEEHHINGDMLDDSQSNALNIALQNPGFTCIEAPPGSGKTFLIAALVGAKYRQTRGEDGSICITATTNNAISNAIDKAHDSFPQIRCIREYSRKMEGEINPKSKEISLREMAINAGKHLDLNKHLALAEAIDTYQECKVGLRSISNVEQGLTLLDELQSADYHLRGNFLEAYQPYVVGTTCELVARRGDHAARKLKTKDNDEKKSEQKRLKRLITHLILDEASQLPPHLALAVYIMLPGLQKITLIGDSEQLGPYTPLNDRTFCYNMIGFGELDRVGGMPHSNKKVHLRHVYRSHPRIVDLLLTPIYGKNLTSALKVEQRSLAKEKGLPCADDSHKSPVLFVNIDKAKNNERGVNEKELAVVLAFIDALKKKGVTGEDVAVVCNHHAQREALLSAMKGKGTIGLLNATVAVHTVDSFQGKEAKVVLLLTTKVSPNSDKNSVNHTFQFIANPNRGTVAVSRGQHAVYLFGEWFNLVKTEFWSKFVPGIVEAKAMVDHEWNPVSCDDYDKLKLAASEAPKTVRGVQSHYTGRGRNHRVSHKQFHRGAHVRGGRGRGVHVQGERRPHHGPISGERKEHRPPGQQHNNRGKQNNRGHRGAGRRARENSGNQESERPQGQQS